MTPSQVCCTFTGNSVHLNSKEPFTPTESGSESESNKNIKHQQKIFAFRFYSMWIGLKGSFILIKTEKRSEAIDSGLVNAIVNIALSRSGLVSNFGFAESEQTLTQGLAIKRMLTIRKALAFPQGCDERWDVIPTTSDLTAQIKSRVCTKIFQGILRIAFNFRRMRISARS